MIDPLAKGLGLDQTWQGTCARPPDSQTACRPGGWPAGAPAGSGWPGRSQEYVAPARPMEPGRRYWTQGAVSPVQETDYEADAIAADEPVPVCGTPGGVSRRAGTQGEASASSDLDIDRLEGIVVLGSPGDIPTPAAGLVMTLGPHSLRLSKPDSDLAVQWDLGDVSHLAPSGWAIGPEGDLLRVIDLTAAGAGYRLMAPPLAATGFISALDLARNSLPSKGHAATVLGCALALTGLLGTAWARFRTQPAVLARRAVVYALSIPLCEAARDLIHRAVSWSRQPEGPIRSGVRSLGLGAAHGSGLTRENLTGLATGAAALSLVLGGLGIGALVSGGSGRSGDSPEAGAHLAPHAGLPAGSGLNAQTMAHLVADLAKGSPGATHLAPALAPPAPAPPSLAGAPPLNPHEVFGFAPYWTLPIASGFDVSSLTTIAYFGVDVNPDGTVRESGSGWDGYQSQDLADLVTRAHAAGDRVVLTAICFSQSALDHLTSDPNTWSRLGSTLVSLVAAKNLDGINLDFEGTGSSDQAGLDGLVAAVSAAMHAHDPSWQLTMDTYASSAGDPAGFFDIAGLAPSVDAFFVMGYDMNDMAIPSPTAPLNGSGSFTDLQTLQEYTSVVAPSKVILGMPFYGYQWPTAGPGMGSPATGPPTPLSYAEIAAAGGPTYWDPATDTPWTSYQVGGQWYQTWYDDPTSLALKAQLASMFHLRGVGIWALGMDGNDPAMLAALTGNSPPLKDFTTGPTYSGTPTTPSTAGSASTSSAPVGQPVPADASTGVYENHPVDLTPADPAALPAFTPAPGYLEDFRSSDPAYACLATGPALDVWSIPSAPGTYLVTARTPTDCANGTWIFEIGTPVSGNGTGSAPTTSSTASSGTTTTSTTSTTSTTGARSGAAAGAGAGAGAESSPGQAGVTPATSATSSGAL